MARDYQRSRVYAWERQAARRLGFQFYVTPGVVVSMEEVAVFVGKVWRNERGRYGKAKAPVPELKNGRGTTWARGSARHLNLPRWSRTPWVMSHEIAHGLTMNSPGGWHGPRFVGALIGIAGRHVGVDVDALLQLAADMDVDVDLRSVGAVANRTLTAKVLNALPGKPVEIAVRLNMEQGLKITGRQVRGAALNLMRAGKARWRGQTIVPVFATLPAVA